MVVIGMVIPQHEQTPDQKENLHFLGIGNPLQSLVSLRQQFSPSYRHWVHCMASKT